MKHTTLRCAAALALSLLLLLSLAACGGSQSGSSGSSGKLDSVKKQDTDAESGGDTDAADDWQGYSEAALASIEGLYVNYWHEEFAAAYLGYREEGDASDIAGWLHNENPALAAFWPFLLEIPEEDIVGDHGYLYCIVPMDGNVSFSVKSVEWEYEGNGATPHYSDPLYYPEVDRPFLLYTARESRYGEDSDVVVETVESDGFVGTWSPGLNSDGGLTNPLLRGGGYAVLEFADLYDVGDYVPHLHTDDGPDTNAEWLPPTDLGLRGTSWYSDNGWLLEFGEDGMALYCPEEGSDGTILTLYDQGTWWMEDDSLCLSIYDGRCPFPLLISPSGEQMVVMQSDDGSVLPFFEPGQSIVGLSLSVG